MEGVIDQTNQATLNAEVALAVRAMPVLARRRRGGYLLPIVLCAAAVIIFLTSTIATQLYAAAVTFQGVTSTSQVNAPGTKTLDLERAGQYRVMVNEGPDPLHPFRPKMHPFLTLTLTSEATGEVIPVTTEPGTERLDRTGSAFRTFTVREPGTYHLDGAYPEGQTGPEALVTITPDTMQQMRPILFAHNVALASSFGLAVVALALAVRTFKWNGGPASIG